MGTVIKAGSAGKLMKRLETLALKDHMAEAHAVVQRARAQALRIVEQAETEAVRIREEASRRGYDDGFARGRRAGHEAGRDEAYEAAIEEFRGQHEQLLTSMKRLVSRVESAKEGLLERARRDLLEFAVSVAERITKQTGLVDREVAVANAREAIDLIGGATDLTARVNPVDMEAMRSYASQLDESLGALRHLTLVEDPRIEPGGCVVSTPEARVDATLTSQFEQAVELLLGTQTPGNEPVARGAGGAAP